MWIKNRLEESAQGEKKQSVLDGIAQAPVAFAAGEYSFHDFYPSDDFIQDEASLLFPASTRSTNSLRERFTQSSMAGQLRGAPLASWFLARMERLSPGFAKGVENEDDLGGYTACYVATKNALPCAMLSIAADSRQVGCGIEAKSEQVAVDAMGRFIELLMAAPESIDRCELTINAAELQTENEYGWNGDLFLGTHNGRA
jgi:hypothetical protein